MITQFNLNMKVITTIALIIIAVFSNMTFAQPVLTADNSNIRVGEKFGYNVFSHVGITEGDSGVMKTWDFSMADSLDHFLQQIVTVKSTGFDSLFPNANIAIKSGTNNFSFCNISSSEALFYGQKGSFTVQNWMYSDPVTLMKYPFSYGNSFNDAFAASLEGTVKRSGVQTVTGDAYGTLILPYGSFSDALRVHVHQRDTDVTSTQTVTRVTDMYKWYVPGIHFEVVIYGRTAVDANQPYFYTSMLDKESLTRSSSILKIKNEQLVIIPNPSSNWLKINYPNAGSEKCQLHLYNVLGEIVYTGFMQKSEELIDVSGLDNGVYLVHLNAGNGLLTQKLVIQH